MSADETATPLTQEALDGAWTSANAFSRVLKVSRKLERTLAETQERLTAWKERAEAAEGRMHFMAMPRDYWDDTWDEETAKQYSHARKRHDLAVTVTTPPSTALRNAADSRKGEQ